MIKACSSERAFLFSPNNQLLLNKTGGVFFMTRRQLLVSQAQQALDQLKHELAKQLELPVGLEGSWNTKDSSRDDVITIAELGRRLSYAFPSHSNSSTTADDLLDACVECHRWMDGHGDGVRHKKKLREGA
jgi:hypothetical protein